MTTKDAHIKNARFDTRLSKDQKDLFERAAFLGGFRNLSDFIIMAVQEKAKEIIAERDAILTSEEDKEIFFNAILNPQPPNESLSKVASKYKELFIL